MLSWHKNLIPISGDIFQRCLLNAGVLFDPPSHVRVWVCVGCCVGVCSLLMMRLGGRRPAEEEMKKMKERNRTNCPCGVPSSLPIPPGWIAKFWIGYRWHSHSPSRCPLPPRISPFPSLSTDLCRLSSWPKGRSCVCVCVCECALYLKFCILKYCRACKGRSFEREKGIRKKEKGARRRASLLVSSANCG